jgi:hypothetical protein
VQRDLAAAAERQAGRRDDHRHVRVAQPHRGALEGAHHQVQLVPVLVLRFEQHQHQVGAGGEVQPFVADDERREVLRRLAHAGLQHLHGVGADGVHLRVELHAQHAVARGPRGWRRDST